MLKSKPRRRRLLRGRKARTTTHTDYTAELKEYIKRYERDAQPVRRSCAVVITWAGSGRAADERAQGFVS